MHEILLDLLLSYYEEFNTNYLYMDIRKWLEEVEEAEEVEGAGKRK